MAGRIAFIGGGAMGEAMLKSLLDRGIAQPGGAAVADVSQARRDLLSARYGITCTGSNREAAAGAGVVVLAVKPQNLPEVLEELRRALEPHQLVLSIVAGATLATLTQGLEHRAAVRVMPNTPAQIAQGMSVWTATEEVSPGQKEAARAILSALGDEVYVEDEKYLDMATALSGSGPAYVFLFIEALVDAGVHIGFSRDVAERLVLQTVAGSALFAQQAKAHPAQLRNAVTSPAGTTAAGLLKLEEAGLRAAVIRAVQASYERSQALGRPVSHE